MNIFSRCWSHRRARAESEPEREPIRVVMHLPDPREAQAVAAAADDRADRVGAPAAAVQEALDEVPTGPADRAPTARESFLNCMHAGFNQSARDTIAMIPANGCALLVRAGLSMARTPGERLGVAAVCLTSTTALVGTHWPEAARLLVEGSRLRGSSIAKWSLTAMPFLLELAALLTPMRYYDPDDSWDIAQSMLIIMTGARLANFIRDHVTQPQQGYWGTMQPVTRDGLNPTQIEANKWRLARTGLQTFTYTGLSLAGTLRLATAISESSWFQSQKANADSPVTSDRYVYHGSQAAPRLMASVFIEVLDPLFIALSGFIAGEAMGLRVKYRPGEHVDHQRGAVSVGDALRANLGSPEGRAATRERARLHSGMRMGLQSAPDVATGFSTLFAARGNTGMADGIRALSAILNGLTETRGFLVDWCLRAMAAERPDLVGHSARVAQARRNADMALDRASAQVSDALVVRGLPPTPDNMATLFQEFEQLPLAQDATQRREGTLFTGEVTVVAGGPAAFNRGLI